MFREQYNLCSLLKFLLTDDQVNGMGGYNKLDKDTHDKMINSVVLLMEANCEAGVYACSAGDAALKRDVRSKVMAKYNMEDWVKDELMGTSFRSENLLGEIPPTLDDFASKNPNLRIKEIPAKAKKSQKGFQSKKGYARSNNQQNQQNQQRGRGQQFRGRGRGSGRGVNWFNNNHHMNAYNPGYNVNNRNANNINPNSNNNNNNFRGKNRN